MVSLLIIDENPLLRSGIQLVVEAEGDVKVVGDTVPSEEAITMVECLLPDVVLMSLKWPDRNALAICREVRERVPTTRVVILSRRDCEEEVLLSILAGASGCISVDAQKPELVQAIRTVVNGGGYFDWEAVQRVMDRLQNSDRDEPAKAVAGVLSDREMTILKMVAEDCTNKQIGQNLNIADKTVRNNLTRIRDKLNLKSRASMVVFAIRHGLVDDPYEDVTIPDVAN